MMTIEDNKLKTTGDLNHSFEKSPNHGGTFAQGLPDSIVIHYTAGSSLSSSAAWLKNPQAKASAHIVIGKTGDIVQLVPFNVKAWHAGKSNWKGRTKLNNFSIGIELDNAGMLEKRADGFYTHFGKRVDNSQVVLASHKHGGSEKAWEAYTTKQMETVEQVCLCLKENYPITEIMGHDDIAPGRKTDPGPAFPMYSFRNKIFLGRNQEETPDTILSEELLAGVVSADYLNIRTQPNANAKLASEPLPKGAKLRILESKDGWLRVKIDLEGWVSQTWVDMIGDW
jgi:N-acetylmuramoyl-L-alanine amidase